MISLIWPLKIKIFPCSYLIMGLFCLCFCQDVKAQLFGFQLEQGKKYSSFPIEIHNQLVVIPVTLGGLIPLKMILDTGVRSTILFDRSYTDILGAPYTRTISITGIGQMRKVEALVAYNMSLDMPGIKGQSQSMLVLAEDYLELSKYLGIEVHGVLGYEVFNRFIVRIDYGKKILTLYDPRYFKTPRRFTRVDIDIIDTKPYLIAPLQFDDTTQIEARLLVDTGASHALLLHTEYDSLMYLPEKRIASKLGRGLTGEVEGHMARVKGLKLSHYKLDEVIAAFPDDIYYTDSTSLDRHGVLGGEVLGKFTVIINYFSGTMLLRKNYKFRKPFEYNMSGLEIMARGKNRNVYQVISVRQDSPADRQQIERGDIIVGINGQEASRLTLSNVFSIMNSKEGKKIRLVIRRGTTITKKKFVLEREI